MNVQIQGRFIEGGGDHHRYMRVDDATADRIYDLVKDFWLTRQNQSQQTIKEVIGRYRQSNQLASMQPVMNKLRALSAGSAPDRPFSLIDFGGANGSLLYAMKDAFSPGALRYLLVEPYGPFVEDFRANFPGQPTIVADAEQFAALDDGGFGEFPFGVFFSSHVLYLIKPSVARAVLEKAGRLTDDILLADNIKNLRGELDKRDTVVFDYYPEGGQVYFSHYFESYLDEIGFDIVEATPTKPRDHMMKLGFGVIHARRRR